MGKTIIIPDADFSEIGVFEGIQPTVENWYVYGYTNRPSGAQAKPANLANGGWAPGSTAQSAIYGHTINSLRFLASSPGSLKIFKNTSLSQAGTLIDTITIGSEEAGKVVTKTVTDFVIASGEYLVIGEANASQGGFCYYDQSGIGFYGKVPSNPTTYNNYSLGFDIGYLEWPE